MKTAYIRIYEKIRGEITTGAFPLGTRLPSKRTLAEREGVSVITVEHAYDLLLEEGYAESRERSGYFVTYRKADFLQSQTAPPPRETVAEAKEAAAVTFPFSVLTKTMRRVMADYGERILLTRSPGRGTPELRLAIAAYLARSHGMRVRPEQLVIGAGAEYLYGMIVKLLGRDRLYAIEDPSYRKIAAVYASLGAEFERLPLSGDGIRSDALAASRATVLHVTPFNSYPSGVFATASKRKEYLDWARERGGYLVEDNYDSELTVSKKFVDPLFSSSDRVLYLNTFSRTVSPALRVGYLILPETLSALFDEKLGFYACTVPVFEQYVLAALLDGGDFERHINRVRRQKRRDAEEKRA